MPNKIREYKNNVISDNYFCLDIETTGLDEGASYAGIVELYFKIVRKDNIIREGHHLFYHADWWRTKSIHKISIEEIKDKPLFVNSDKLKLELLNYFNECSSKDSDLVFMSHYSPFEFKWMSQFLNFSEDLRDIKRNKIRTFDTRMVAKHLFPNESRSLIPLCKKYNISPPKGQNDFHRADQDVHAMYELYKILINEIPEDEITEYKYDSYMFSFEDKR